MATSPDRLVAGLIGDRYEITGLIASGGMGQVYRARDTVLGRTVALKVLRAGSEDEAFIARFRTEATNAARLSHPNIVQVYDFGNDDGVPFMAMEYVDGQTLRSIMQGRTALRPDLAARIAMGVAAALEAARRQGIVHRDIKPENILLTTDGQVKVADFGLSHALAEVNATQTGMLLGTAHYLAPEQVAGGQVDHRSDLYALGVMLFEMLTGHPPFSGDTPVVIAYKRVNEDVPSVLIDRPDAPRALDTIVANATARDPMERYTTAAQLMDDLRDAMPRSDTDDLTGLVHHTTAIPLGGDHDTIAIVRKDPARRRRIRRHRLIALLTVLGLLAGTALITGPFGKVSLPSVLGVAKADARSTLTDAGMRVDETFENSATIEEGAIITQIPGPGASVRRGTVVLLVVSAGPSLEALPDLSGETFRAASERMEALGIELVRVDRYHPSVPRNRLIRLEHAPGTVVQVGTSITAFVSRGPEMVDVPRLIGDSQDAAVAQVRALGFQVSISRERHASIPQGVVISQSPTHGIERAKGSTIALVVSLGPPLVKSPSLECMTRKQAQDAAAARGLSIDFSGRGTRVVDQDPPPGTKIARGSTVTAYLGHGSFC